MDDVVGTDVVVPAALILMGVDVELYCDLCVRVKIELLDVVFAEDGEEDVPWVLSWDFDDCILRCP